MKPLDADAIDRNENRNPSDGKLINKTMGVKEWGLILVLSIIWGGSFFFIKVAVP